MLPQIQDDLISDVTYETQPSYTYEMNADNNKVAGYCKGLTAMEQAIYKILNTERYQNVIYSWNYGVELSDLIGQPITYCVPEIERRIKEALLQDDRISEVSNFVFTYPKKRLICVVFDVKTLEGDTTIQKEVNV